MMAMWEYMYEERKKGSVTKLNFKSLCGDALRPLPHFASSEGSRVDGKTQDAKNRKVRGSMSEDIGRKLITALSKRPPPFNIPEPQSKSDQPLFQEQRSLWLGPISPGFKCLNQ